MPDAAQPCNERRKVAVPWGKRDDETDRAYDVFRAWLNIGRGRKNVQAQALAGHKTKRTVAGWSSNHDWQARARAYDERADDRADSVLLDERAELMRNLVRDRVAYQRDFHNRCAKVPALLEKIAEDEDASPTARVAAMRTLIEHAGYSPTPPAEREEGISEIMVAELLRVVSVLAPEKRAGFSALLDEATVIRASMRDEEGAE